MYCIKNNVTAEQTNDFSYLKLFQHSCTKVRFNGRNGVIVAGGSSDANPALSSLEFYDLNTGKWYSLGRMTQGRRFPAITLMNGKLMVTGKI